MIHKITTGSFEELKFFGDLNVFLEEKGSREPPVSVKASKASSCKALVHKKS